MGFTGEAAAEELTRLLSGMSVTGIVQAAARLGVADAVGHEGATVEELAVRLGVGRTPVRRLLRGLAAVGVLEEVEPDRYAHNEVSRLLRSDVEDSMLTVALLSAGRWNWSLWSRLADAVCGVDVAHDEFGKDLYAYLVEDAPADGELFNRAMADTTKAVSAPVVDALDLAGARTVADVGGGRGELLLALLAEHPELEAVLFDLEEVLPQVLPALREGPQAERCRLVGGDCLAAVPVVADVYLVKHMVHQWDDDKVGRMLGNVAAAAPAGARVVVIEQVVSSTGPGAEFTMIMDLQMMLTLDGHERTERDFAQLFAAVGLEFVGVTPTDSALSLIEARLPAS